MTPEEAVEALAYLRDGYTPYAARGCPACVYQDGKFIRSCRLHQEIDALQTANDTLGAAEAKLIMRAQMLASAVRVSKDDPDEWHVLRMEALRVRNGLYNMLVHHKVLEGPAVPLDQE